MPKSLGCPLWGKVTPGGGTQARWAACLPQCKATTQAPLPSSGPAGAPTQGWVASCCALSRTWKRKIQKPKFFRTKLKTFCPVRVQCVTPAHIARKKTLVGKVNPAHRSCVTVRQSRTGQKKISKKNSMQKSSIEPFSKKNRTCALRETTHLEGHGASPACARTRAIARPPSCSPNHSLPACFGPRVAGWVWVCGGWLVSSCAEKAAAQELDCQMAVRAAVCPQFCHKSRAAAV